MKCLDSLPGGSSNTKSPDGGSIAWGEERERRFLCRHSSRKCGQDSWPWRRQGDGRCQGADLDASRRRQGHSDDNRESPGSHCSLVNVEGASKIDISANHWILILHVRPPKPPSTHDHAIYLRHEPPNQGVSEAPRDQRCLQETWSSCSIVPLRSHAIRAPNEASTPDPGRTRGHIPLG